MMRDLLRVPNILAPLLVAWLVLVVCAVEARQAPADPRGDTSALAEYVRAFESVGFSGAVLAARNGEIVAAFGVGSPDPVGQRAITPDTLFEIASVTKSFTAVAVMRLVEQGRLALDDPIATHLPDVPAECSAITVRHLLQHTSGIPGTNSRGSGDDLSVVLPMFLNGGPRHEPGTQWEYWNQGYALLSAIIESAAGEPYTDFVRRAVFDPAGMAQSCFTGDAPPTNAVVSTGVSGRGAARSALEHPYGSYGYQYRGMGGLVTSVRDLWKFDRALHGASLLSEASKAEMFKPGLGDYGLGWFVRTNARGQLVQEHGGSVRGFVCDVRRYPQQDAALFVLCNRDDIPVNYIANNLEAMLFDEAPGGVAPPAPLPAELQSQLAGRYIDDRGTELIVAPDDKATRATVKWGAYPDTRGFLGTNTDGDLVFFDWSESIEMKPGRDKDGRIVKLSMMGGSFHRAAPGERVAQRSPGPAERIVQRSPAPAVPPLKPLDAARSAELVGRYDDEDLFNLTITVEGEGREAKGLFTFKSRPDLTMGASLHQDQEGGIVLIYGGGPLDVAVERDAKGAIVRLTTSGKQAFPRPFQRLAEGEEPTPAPTLPQPRSAPAGGPPQWAESLLGTYRDEKGIELIVAMSGRMVTSHIHWSPQGPITYARLQHDEEKGIEFVEFSRNPSTYPLEITRDEAGRATRITLKAGDRQQQFDRVSEDSQGHDEPKK